MFDDDRYFDVFVEYAKGDRRRTFWCGSRSYNRGPEAARLHLLADDLVPQYLVVGSATKAYARADCDRRDGALRSK